VPGQLQYKQPLDMIYFIQGQKTQLIKIGLAEDVKRRLSNLQTGSPDVLVFLGGFPGDEAIETRVHARFRSQRKHGEWFEPSDALNEFIQKRCVRNFQDLEYADFSVRRGFASVDESLEFDPEELVRIGKSRLRNILPSL
jgi:hypothetical protein